MCRIVHQYWYTKIHINAPRFIRSLLKSDLPLPDISIFILIHFVSFSHICNTHLRLHNRSFVHKYIDIQEPSASCRLIHMFKVAVEEREKKRPHRPAPEEYTMHHITTYKRKIHRRDAKEITILSHILAFVNRLLRQT